ncbi:TlpA family protein disulfide reductase [Nocardia terpenica]|uniref:Thioredoxin n=1 Tax=Nocardia terpenica TaxID=455432 RepID=A0A291RCI2_9NOCA|nr:TlpA disulfide reductase family protein [Nocardia terpenica]ATL65276.1 thioredoxin [Nocardia terpenica]
MRSVPAAWRWTLVALIAVVALGIALWPRDGRTTGRDAATAPTVDPVTAVSSEARAAARLALCPRSGDTGAGPLAGIAVDCLADGRPIDLAAALAGRPALLNLWAWWCTPCAHELPALQQYADRAGSAITVLTVHSDPDEGKALARLTDLGVRLPGVQDPNGQVRRVVAAPNALPVSVLVRPDGAIAKMVVRPFRDVDDIASTVASELGVSA